MPNPNPTKITRAAMIAMLSDSAFGAETREKILAGQLCVQQGGETFTVDVTTEDALNLYRHTTALRRFESEQTQQPAPVRMSARQEREALANEIERQTNSLPGPYDHLVHLSDRSRAVCEKAQTEMSEALADRSMVELAMSERQPRYLIPQGPAPSADVLAAAIDRECSGMPHPKAEARREPTAEEIEKAKAYMREQAQLATFIDLEMDGQL